MAFNVSTARIEAFRAWLEEFGLSGGTIGVYVTDLEKAVEHGGFLERLRDDALAPKTKRHYLAAARRWADFDDDPQLAKALKKLRLPPPRRKAAKVPITKDQLIDLVEAIPKSELTPVMKATLLMMACRGLRCGDVLRLQRDDLLEAKEKGTLSFEAKGQRRLEFKVLKTYRAALLTLAEQPGQWHRVDELVAPHAAPAGRRKAAARSVERVIAKLGVRLGIYGLHPHRLRRTYAVEYLRALKGDPEGLIKLTEHMQWASMATAMEYVNHARGDELDTFAEKIFER